MSQKKIFLLILFIISSILIIYNRNFLNFEIDKILEKILIFKKDSYLIFIFILFFSNFLIFLTPIPTTPFIIFNGFVLGEIGFFFSYSIIIICSIILFKFIKKFKFLLSLSLFKNLEKKAKNNKNVDLNFMIIGSSRYVLPYFVHNLFFGLILKKINIFFLAILLFEIPIIFILNKFGRQIKNLDDISNINLNSILSFDYLITFILLFFLLILFKRASIFIKQKLK